MELECVNSVTVFLCLAKAQVVILPAGRNCSLYQGRMTMTGLWLSRNWCSCLIDFTLGAVSRIEWMVTSISDLPTLLVVPRTVRMTSRENSYFFWTNVLECPLTSKSVSFFVFQISKSSFILTFCFWGPCLVFSLACLPAGSWRTHWLLRMVAEQWQLLRPWTAFFCRLVFLSV